MRSIRMGLWEKSIKRLRDLDPPIAEDATDLAPVLESIEKRLAQYIPLDTPEGATRLFVSQLTREHLRKTISFFLSTSSDQQPVPFQEVGTGTLNILVLALLSFIAEVKKDNVIFAMEEPEIALPPHTQRRVANYLLSETTQCFVTSHSPYIIERFDPEQILILRRDAGATVTATPVILGGNLKDKHYRRHTRRGLAEAMLGRAVIITEGITEQLVLGAVADKMESSNNEYYPLDLSGVTIFPVDGDGALPAFGAFFRSLGLQTFGFYDKKTRTPEENKKFVDNFDLPCETGFLGMEQLLVNEVPVARQWEFLDNLRQSANGSYFALPTACPPDDSVKQLMLKCLKSNKGNGYASELIAICGTNELPVTIEAFLAAIYAFFPQPTPAPLPPATSESETQDATPIAGSKD
jgi:putative ATP-dependent endonuclease of OLD family